MTSFDEWKADFLARCAKEKNYMDLDNYRECWNAAIASVVLPERRNVVSGEFPILDDTDYAKGWDDCLDEIRALNPTHKFTSDSRG